MKLRAVRLSEVGHFGTGVALEGLSGGFDVLAGPNEMGKSTIFRAIEAAFKVRHTSGGKDACDLAAMPGGAPLVEVDFEVDGRLWRIRKRYLAQKSAELVDLGGGPPLRGADAETKLARLVGGRLDRSGLLGLIWVRQRMSVELPEGEPEITKGLGRLIEDEIADAAGGGAARRVREAVALALEKLVTKATYKPSAGKPYKIAVDARDRAKAELESARAAADQAAKRLSDLESARARAEALRSPEAANARADMLTRLTQRRGAIARAEEEFRLATQVVAEREARLENLRSRHERLASAIAEAAKLRALLLACAKVQSQVSADVSGLRDALAGLQTSQLTARTQAVDLQSQLDLVDRQERARRIAHQIEELVERLNSVSVSTTRIAAIEAMVARDPIDDNALRELRRSSMDTERLEARAVAALPRVRIDYLPDAEGLIRVAGNVVTRSGEVAPGEALHLDIEGIGRITITAPSASLEPSDNPVASAHASRAKMLALLARLNVADLDAAERQHAARTILVSERETLVARVKADAPDGVSHLSQKHADAVAELAAFASLGDAPTTPRPELETRLLAVRAEVTSFDAREVVTQAALLEASKREAQISAEQVSAAARLAELEKILPPPDEAARRLPSMGAELVALDAGLQSAIRDRGVWKAAIAEPAERAALERDLIVAERAIREVEQSAQQLAVDIKGLESALNRDRCDGVEARVVELRECFDAAEARVSAFATEVRELQLLETLLHEREKERRSTELAPVVTRLQKLASSVLPGATFELGDTLRVTGIARGGQTLSTQRLSGGTQEQLALLVRLAYGQLLADRQSALPLVLDDALVYSDDGRFAAMLELLAEASTHHQVVMLTCQAGRIGSFGSKLPMTLVGLTPWRHPD